RCSSSKRLHSTPSWRRVHRSTTKAYRSFPSNQTSANGLPSFARNLPTSNTLFQRFIAISICHLTRYKALMASALSKEGAPPCHRLIGFQDYGQVTEPLSAGHLRLLPRPKAVSECLDHRAQPAGVVGILPGLCSAALLQSEPGAS